MVLLGLTALIDCKLKPYWGSRYSALNALLLLFTLLSFLYQLALLFHFPLLFSLIDVAAVLPCAVFFKPIWNQLKEYGKQLIKERPLYLLYPFLGYLFFLSIVAVPGWNYDSMIYHLTRPLLHLQEGTLFTPHYSDGRQVAWPMGAEVLTYLFTRYGSAQLNTFGVGFLQYIFYLGTILAVYQAAVAKTSRQTAATLTFVAASFPVLVYGATTIKNDLAAVFAFVMLWIYFDNFRQSRSRSDFWLIFLALAFGLSCKITFLVLGILSLLVFVWIDKRCQDRRCSYTPGTFCWLGLFIICFLFLAQAHLYIYNLITYGHLTGDEVVTTLATRTWESFQWKAYLQDFIKYQLTLFDFVLPLSWKNIPFVDTWLSSFYNHTIGKITGDAPWNYRYFPEEMRAAFGPLAILILWQTVRTALSRSEALGKALAWITLFWIFFVPYKTPWGPVHGIRYFAPTFIAALIFLPALFQSKVFQWHRSIRFFCTALLMFSCAANYEKPLVAYHPKAIPWYRYAFTDRGWLYHHKYFLDDRMDVYQELVKPGDRVFVFAGISDWVFPYYQYAPEAKIRLGNFQYGKNTWSQIDFHDYDLIVCNSLECIQEWNPKDDFEKVWKSSSPQNAEPDFIEKIAAFYRPKKN